ncbi:MAG: hypothetical protein KDA44_05495 [Planctomycetales bacterium]|nr:hypothetical protein [Planctomycetales bacterium]
MLSRRILQVASWLSLAALIGPPTAFLAGRMELDAMKIWMLVATVTWFIVTPLWMGREKPHDAASEAA